MDPLSANGDSRPGSPEDPAPDPAIERHLAAVRSTYPRLSATAAADRYRRGALLVDIRPEAQRHQFGDIPAAVVIERNVLEWRLDPTSPDRDPQVTDDPDRVVVVICQEGYASSLAAASLRAIGVRGATDLDGGFVAWKAAGLPVRAAARPVGDDRPVGVGVAPAGDLAVLGWPALDDLGVEALVTTRHGGVSDGPYRSLNLGLHVGDQPDLVIENRVRAAAAVGASLDDLVLGTQVHGDRATVVTGQDRGRGAREAHDAVVDTDALVTTGTGVVLVTLVADCVPVVLVDPRAGVLATVHAGWRGTAARVVEATLAAMADLGARPADVWAGIGPAVAPDRYQVGVEVADALEQAMGDLGAADVLVADGPGHWRADLVAANHRQLERAGVPAGQVLGPPCATGRPGPFFSDRESRPCGRFALLAVRRA